MTASDHAVKLASIAALAADEKLAQEIAVIDVSEQLVITDCFVIASGETDRQVSAIVDEVEDKLREAGARPIRKEGVREGRWALLDYGELVVHVQRANSTGWTACGGTARSLRWRAWSRWNAPLAGPTTWTCAPSPPLMRSRLPTPSRMRTNCDPQAHHAAARPDGIQRLWPHAGADGHQTQRRGYPPG